MDRTKLLTAGVTILAATASVGLMIYNEAKYQRVVDDSSAAVAVVQPAEIMAPAPDPGPAIAAPVAISSPVAFASLSAPVLAVPDARPSVPEILPDVAMRDASLPDLPEDRAVPSAPLATDTGLAVRVARLGRDDAGAPPLTQPVPRNSFGVPCGVTASASARPVALVALTVTAPCRPNATVRIRHGDLVFTDRTNALGVFRADLPALQSPAEIEVRFVDGESALTTVEVPDLAAVERVALQWIGQAGLQLHALEFGADYGDGGHVWSGAPRDAQFAETGRGGFLVRLGDETGFAPRMAEVYTFPSGTALEDGVVRLSVEAEVTSANCASEVAAETFQPDGITAPAPVALTLAMPGCDAVGDFLVLKNVLRDLRIAAR